MYEIITLHGHIYTWEQIEEKLRSLGSAQNEEELLARIKDCSDDIANITQVAVLKQNVGQLISNTLL